MPSRGERVARAWPWAALSAALIGQPIAAQAQGTRLAVVVVPADEASATVAEELRTVLNGSALGQRYEIMSVEQTLGGAAVSRAHQEIEAAARQVERARDAFYRLDVAQAATLLQEAVATLERHPAYLRDLEPLVQGLMLLGGIQLLQRQASKASPTLTRALSMRPDLEPDPKVFNPPMITTFRSLAARLSTSRGALVVLARPADAMIYVDGRLLGAGPTQRVELHEGRHFVRVVRDGFASWGGFADVIAGAEIRLFAKMKGLRAGRELNALSDAARAGAVPPEVIVAAGKLLKVQHLILSRVQSTRSEGGQAATVHMELFTTASGQPLASSSQTLALPLKSEGAREVTLRAGAAFKPPAFALNFASFRGEGLSEPAVRWVKKRLTERLADLGASVAFLAANLEQSCFADATCVRKAAEALQADALLVANCTGGGSAADVSITVHDAATGVILGDTRMQLSLQDDAATLAETRGVWRIAHLVWDHRVSRPAKAASEVVAAADKTTGGVAPAAGANVESPLPAGAPATEITAFTPPAGEGPTSAPGVAATAVERGGTNWLGIAAIGAGIALAAGGSLLAARESGVLDDPASSGDRKEQARRTGLIGLGLAGAGVLLSGGGVWLVLGSAGEP